MNIHRNVLSCSHKHKRVHHEVFVIASNYSAVADTYKLGRAIPTRSPAGIHSLLRGDLFPYFNSITKD